MVAALLRLAILVAVALMPLSMAAPASAVRAPAATAGHCEESQKPDDAPAQPQAHCAACAALPAVQTPETVVELRPTMLLMVRAERWTTEHGPETDTPPPKRG